MQLLWFLPSLAYGVMLGITSNNYFLAATTLFTMLIALLIRYRLSKRPKLTDATKLRVIDREIWLDDFRMPRGELFWTREQADFIFERLGDTSSNSDLRADYLLNRFDRSRASLNVALGFSENAIVQKSLVDDGPHAILIGSTGSGKTELLRLILRELLQSDAPPELACIDFKGGLGLEEFRSKSLAFASDHDLEQTQKLFEWLETELARRELSRSQPKSLVIAIDELSHLLSSVKKCADVLNSIAARGRSAQMHLVMTNQNLVGVNRALLSNVKLRVLIGNPDPVDAAMLGQLARSKGAGLGGLASAQIVAHGAVAEQFSFPLPIEQRLEQPQPDREPLQLPSSRGFRRGYSNQARARHRLSRQPSIRGLLSRERMAGSH
jgi:S-DNA-T family DNA segregation ATPase FtsK/SpoIIIE